MNNAANNVLGAVAGTDTKGAAKSIFKGGKTAALVVLGDRDSKETMANAADSGSNSGQVSNLFNNIN